MVMNRNNKGYMLIEIIMAAAIGIGIAIFVVSLIIKIKNKNDDAVVDSLTTTDTTIVTNKLMEYAIAEKENFDCSKLTLTGKTLKYDEEIINVFNDYINLSDMRCSNKNGKVSIFIPVDAVQIPGEYYDIEIDYKYIVGSLSYPYIKVETDNPTEYSKSKKINFIVGSEFGLLGGTYRIKYKWSIKKVSCNDIDDSNYVDIKVNDKDTEVSLSEDKLVEINGVTGKGKVYACNITPISDYDGDNVLPETIASEDAYLDNKPPVCSLTHNGSKVYFSKKEDADSGVLEYGINKTKDSPTYDKATHDDNSKRLGFGWYTSYYGYVKDRAGNEGTCSGYWTPPPPPPSSGGCCGSMGYCDCGCDPSNSRCG